MSESKDCGCENVNYLIHNCTSSTFWENFDRKIWDGYRKIEPIARYQHIKEMIQAVKNGDCLGVPTVVYRDEKCRIMDGQKRIGVAKMLGRKSINILKVVYD